jgi:hypothetical protein
MGGISSLNIICLQGKNVITKHDLFTWGMLSLDNLFKEEECHQDRICLQGRNVITRKNLFTGRKSLLDRIYLHGECHH